MMISKVVWVVAGLMGLVWPVGVIQGSVPGTPKLRLSVAPGARGVVPGHGTHGTNETNGTGRGGVRITRHVRPRSPYGESRVKRKGRRCGPRGAQQAWGPAFGTDGSRRKWGERAGGPLFFLKKGGRGFEGDLRRGAGGAWGWGLNRSKSQGYNVPPRVAGIPRGLLRRRDVSIRLTSAVVVSSLCASLAAAGDWPSYRHDFARSGVTDEALSVPLHRQWVHRAAHAPRPAWPEPGRELNRVAFDYVYEVTAAEGLAYYGSSADHKVYAVDLGTGQVRWSFFTGGPVRFAPELADGRVFVASDDGVLTCLRGSDGRVLWQFRGAPRSERLMGNEQMMSRWPLRSGVAVVDGVVYVCAGMWPSEGVYLYALRAEDGTPLWENATSGTSYLAQPHPGSHAMTGVTPQGYLLGQGDQLFVPTGRNLPAAFDRQTGKLLYYRSQPSSWSNRWGGSWNFLAGGTLFGWLCHIGPDIDVLEGEYPPDKNDGMVAFDARSGKERREVRGKLCAVASGKTLYATGSGKLTAYDLAAWLKRAPADKCTRWEADQGRTYALILAGGTLFAGGQGTVTAFDAATGKQVWSDKLEGQARSLAVADGRLLVSTTKGHIVCYGADTVAEAPVVALAKPPAESAGDADAAALARQVLEDTGKTEGCCLVLGASDGQLVRQLVRQSKLYVYCIEPSARRTAALREALDATGLYGVRAVVHNGPLDRLACPDYFADVIVAGNGTARGLRRCPPAEVYRVLRPCGGVVWAPLAPEPSAVATVGRFLVRVGSLGTAGPVSHASFVRWAQRGGVPDAEIQSAESALRAVRGPLPDTDDWTHQYASAERSGASKDRRVRVPLRVLWFGEPGPAPLITRHWAGPAPLCVGGRMFVFGQRTVMAVDAYNGRSLWRRHFAMAGWWPAHTRGASAAADADGVYLIQGKTCLRLDPATGRTVQTYTMPPAPATIPKKTADALVWSYLAVSGDHILGSMGNRIDSRAIFVLGKDGKTRWVRVTEGIATQNTLVLDGRRVYMLDRTPDREVAQARQRGRSIAAIHKVVALDATTGKPAWQTAEGIAGRSALWLSDGVLVATSREGLTGIDAASGKLLYSRDARVARAPVITGGTIYVEPVAYDLRTGKPKERANPFTGEATAWSYRRSYGCGSIAGGANLLMFRSGTLGFLDLAGDTGVHNFGGVRAGCYVNAIAANGLLLAPPADAACTCSYSLRTTVALMPTEHERDWSIAYDRLPETTVHQAAFNCGAVGDRKDAAGALWLAMPRPVTSTRRRPAATPFRFTVRKPFGPYRRDPERAGIRRTDRPWLYASGLKGIERAEVDLAILPRSFTAWPTDTPPAIDGRLTAPVWDGYRAVPLGGNAGTLTLRYDADNLYVACARPPGPKPWKAATRGSDAPVWTDDSFEVYLSPVPADTRAPSRRCLHLGVSASGARYDGLWTHATPRLPTLDIPRVDATADGKPEDWGERGLRVQSLPGPSGRLRDPKDFDPSFRIGWNDQGLLVLAQVSDNVVHEWENEAQLERGDSLQIFLATAIGARGAYRCIVSPGPAPGHKPRVRLIDSKGAANPKSLAATAAGAKTPGGYLVELLLPWKNLGLTPQAGLEVAFQILATDDDTRGDRHRFTALWHQAGSPAQNPQAYQTFRLAAEAGPPLVFTRGKKKDRGGFFSAVAPHALPVAIPPLGAHPEDAAYSGEWASAVKADAGDFAAELAIPWNTLAAAGLQKANLMIHVGARGPLRRPPVLGQGYERAIAVPAARVQPRRLTLRLHFAELDDVRRGQRVFDVKVQGKTVLRGLDVVRAAGGRRRALVKEIHGVVATRSVAVEFVPRAGELTESTAPILSAIEVLPPAPPE